MIAEAPRLPVVAMPDPPAELERRPYAPQPPRVPALRLQLGITGEHRQAGDYGPTSYLSEDLLLRGYGLLRDEER